MLHNDKFIKLLEKTNLSELEQAELNVHVQTVKDSHNAAAINKATNKYEVPALILAIQHHPAIAETLLSIEGIDVSVKDKHKNTPLHIAACFNNEKIIDQLLAFDHIKIDAANEDDEIPLHFAVRRGASANINIITKLCNEKVINLTGRRHDSGTPLSLAISSQCSLDIIKKLYQTPGCNILAAGGAYHTTAIITAVSYSQQFTLPILQKFIHSSDQAIRDAIFLASVQCNNARLMSELLNTDGFDVNAKDASGRTGLMSAALSAYSLLTNPLLADDRTEVNVRDNTGYTALIHAIRVDNTNAIYALIKHKKIESNIADNEGNTALLHAVNVNYYDSNKVDRHLTELFTNPTIKINVINKKGDSALTIAASKTNHNSHLKSWLYIAARLLLKSKDPLTEKELIALKPHKEMLFDALKIQYTEISILKEIFEKPDSILHHVFYYKNSSITKGGLQKLHQRYLALSLPKPSPPEAENLKAITLQITQALNSDAKQKYNTVLTLLNDQLNLLTPEILDLLKPHKKQLYEIFKIRPNLLTTLKNIIEGRHATFLGKLFWHGNTALDRGGLKDIYADYQVMIKSALLKMPANDLQPNDTQLITEFINGGGAFALEDNIVTNTLWKWFKQIPADQVTATGLEGLTKYLDQFDKLARAENPKPALLSKVFDKNMEMNTKNSTVVRWFSQFLPAPTVNENKVDVNAAIERTNDL